MTIQRRVVPKLAANYINKIASITITLDNGDKETFSPADELAIPSDPLMQRKALQQVPSQLAFWAYQAERAFTLVRDLRRELARDEGFASLGYRMSYDEAEQKYTEDMIRSRVSIDKKVDDLRKALTEAETTYGVLRATREAVEHRAFALRKLIGSES